MATVTAAPPLVSSDVSTLKGWGTKPMQLALAVGIVSLVSGAIAGVMAGDGFRHLAYSYLVNLCFFCSLSLGALFFVMIQYPVRAGWSVVVRRLAEIMAMAIFPLGLLFIPILLSLLFGSHALFEWNSAELRETDALIAGKAPYLNAPFFVVRALLYFAVWTLMARRFFTKSLEQDQTGSPEITGQLEFFSAGMILPFALTLTFAAFDWLMSLDPHWFSTIFGVYYFAGSMVSFFASVTIFLYILQGRGLVRSVSVEHRHDLGKLLFGFNCFWAYSAMSQYLLIWYADIPEETGWFKIRQEQGWLYVSIALIACHFAIPFLGFISRDAKRYFHVQVFWAVWLLVMHWVDLYWLAMPNLDPSGPPFGVIDIGMFVGVGGVYLASVLYFAADHPLTPLRDPRLPESLHFHNI